MRFDFDSFIKIVKLAYERVGGSRYCLENILYVFHYYFNAYEAKMKKVHPFISVCQTADIIKKMPYSNEFELRPDDYEHLIDQHFATKYRRCDYNINHFFSGRIRDLRYFEHRREAANDIAYLLSDSLS